VVFLVSRGWRQLRGTGRPDQGGAVVAGAIRESVTAAAAVVVREQALQVLLVGELHYRTAEVVICMSVIRFLYPLAYNHRHSSDRITGYSLPSYPPSMGSPGEQGSMRGERAYQRWPPDQAN
jgi:hypothetical protein